MNDDTLLEASTSQAQGFAPLGEVLSVARKVKKLSAQDVSNNLRLSIKQISDIENNDFSTLPQPMITRGFIRNYARLLEIDAEPLLDSYRARMPDKTPKSMSVQSSMYQVVSGKENQPWLKYILGSILILLFLLAWIFYIDYMPKPLKNPTGKAPEAVVATPPTTDLALPEIALPAAERQAEPSEVVTGTDSTTTITTLTLPAETKPSTDNQPVTNMPVTAPFPNAVSPNATIPNTATTQAIKSVDSDKSTITTPSSAPLSNTISTNPASPTGQTTANHTAANSTPKTNSAVDFSALKEKAGQNSAAYIANKSQMAAPVSQSSNGNAAAQKVSVTITEKTWIQATDKSGKVIYERILPAGSSDGFDGQPPFTVVIGNAKATKLSFLGKPIDLAPNTAQNNVARIRLE
ncbi:MAG: DUF4115 domain-containing protein [Methylotenera sp.]|nr:DUF4115 domain-containing protein [Methylotenera sp.]